MKPVRLGFIGCGKIVSSTHAPLFKELQKDCQIVALHDVKAANAENLRDELELEATACRSLSSFFKNDLDAVVVSTPNDSHCKLTLRALSEGCHVMVEKPMAATLLQADKMIQLAQKKRKVLHVNQSLRVNPVYQTVKDLVAKGRVGEVIHARCLRAGSKTPDQGWSPGATWFVQKRSRGGLIMDIAVHMIDQLQWIVGDIQTIHSINPIHSKGGEVPDNVNALIAFENGATGVLELSWTFPRGAGFLEIYGTKGTIRFGFKERELELAKGDGDFRPVKLKKTKNSQKTFIDSVQGKASTPIPGEVGRSALAACLAIEKSGKYGRPFAPGNCKK